MVCAPALAMEEDELPAAAPVAEQSTALRQLGSALLWPFRPFEIVDKNDAVRQKYKAKILDNWDTICKKPEGYDALSEQKKKMVDYQQNKFQHLQDDKDNPDVLPTRNEVLVFNYGYRCKCMRWIPKFLHGSPYSYFASGLYYCALGVGGWKGAEKIIKILAFIGVIRGH